MTIPKINNTFASNLDEITMDDLKRLKDIQQQAEPYIVKSHDIHIDADFADWIADIKSRYRSAQVKTAVKVNAEKPLFNWLFGRDLMLKKAEERWGAGVVEQVSLDLKREFHDAQGVPHPISISIKARWSTKLLTICQHCKANLFRRF